MIASFIVRLVNTEGDLLAWTEVMAESRPQGRPRSTPFHALAPSQFVIEKDGIASKLIVHWHDLDVVREAALMERVQVQIGQMFTFHWLEPVWLVEGSKSEIVLPPVTVRSAVRVSVPAGGLGVVTPA